MQIGNTPLLRLERVIADNGVEIWVKWEGANPTGSMKDRMGLSMVQGAIARGQLTPGGRVVDFTGGSTGSSLAMVCAALGFRAHVVSSDLFQTGLARVRQLAAESNTFWPQQFDNPGNRGGSHAMADESRATLGLNDLAGELYLA